VRAALGDDPYCVLHPGSGDNFPGRRWTPSGFAALGRYAAGAGLRVVVTGLASERDLVARVVRDVGAGAIDAAGRFGLEELVALLAGAVALASNDTGPVHLAGQLGTPVLAFYGPNTPVLYGPLGERSRALYLGLPCSPCLTTASHRSSRCRIHTCMEALSTGRALGEWRALLVREDEAAKAPGGATR
jgi:ADP-heptose:LPS heptosyltransferase